MKLNPGSVIPEEKNVTWNQVFFYVAIVSLSCFLTSCEQVEDFVEGFSGPGDETEGEGSEPAVVDERLVPAGEDTEGPAVSPAEPVVADKSGTAVPVEADSDGYGVLRPGTRLVYRIATDYDHGEDRELAARFVSCDISGTGTGALVKFSCSEDLSESFEHSSLPLFNTEDCYRSSESGIYVSSQCEEGVNPDEMSPMLVHSEDDDQFDHISDRTVLGYETDLVMFLSAMPDEDEAGDYAGGGHTYSDDLGIIWGNEWFVGGMAYDRQIRLHIVDVEGQPIAGQEAVSEQEARRLLEQWLSAQNSGDFEAYSLLYGTDFEGIKRVSHRVRYYDREGWIEDRGQMFQSDLRVSASDRQVVVGRDRTALLFTQSWSNGRFSDRGPKELILVREGGAVRIQAEEMIFSVQLD